MKGSQIRASFLAFFRDRGHTVHPADSLVPTNDPSLLFTGAGMNQFKDMFLGRGSLPFARAATSQKCLRTGDIDNVGKTPSHHTFFEMLGNFSFGDYFKQEAIRWAWEWVTDAAKLPESRLSVSVYEDDDEAFGIWEKQIGLPKGRIYRLGEHDNFWPADAPSEAPEGTLCGPCSEIFYDWGPESGCGRPECNPACECRRYVEVWNLVFQQFEKGDGAGVLKPLATKNIDTGMGLERAAAVLQGVRSNFEADLFAPLVRQVAEAAERTYGKKEAVDQRLRRIADHARAVAFCIGDGALPSNEGRGYVVRRLLRRAVLDGRRLGIEEPFVFSIVPTVASLMGDQYPEIVERRDSIASFVKGEEERFGETLTAGLQQLEKCASGLARGATLEGRAVFTLYDTYGFPPELTEEILAERGMRIDHDGFEREMAAARARSRGGTTEDIFGYAYLKTVKDRTTKTEFVGYGATETEATIVALVRGEKERGEVVESLQPEEGEDVTCQIVLDRTPFYGEAGGQVGDAGELRTPEGAVFVVNDTQRAADIFLHRGTVVRGTLRTGAAVTAVVDAARRLDIQRNHTATHILHHQLREVLGSHVEQAGSLVEPDRLRLDFSHGEAMTSQELDAVEAAVNEHILSNDPVGTLGTTVEDARARGAMALFGEKYGSRVRMVSVGEFSKELCGGTHLDRTGQIGLFRIVSEESIAAGVRRITAVTGHGAYRLTKDEERILHELARELKSPPAELPARVTSLGARLKRLERDLDAAKRKALTGGGLDSLLSELQEVRGVKVLAANLGDAVADDLRKAGDVLKPKLAAGGARSVLVLAGSREGKVSLACWVMPKGFAKVVKAGAIVRHIAPIVGGGGGGKDEMAQAGGKEPARIGEALRAVEEIVRRSVN